jgi:hypothetical protein
MAQRARFCCTVVALIAFTPGHFAAQSPASQPAVLRGRIVLEWSGDEPLFRISGAAMTEDGRLFVAERDDSRVREYNPQTRVERVLLRKGSGPREVVAPCCLGVTSDGFLVARDNGNGRWVGIRVSDGRDSSFVVRQAAPVGNAEFSTPVRGRAFADQYWSAYPTNGRAGQRRVRWVTTSGVVSDSISHPMATWDSTAKYAHHYRSGQSNGTRYAYPLFGRRTLRTSSATGVGAEANSDRNAIRILGPDGREVATIRLDAQLGPALTNEDRAAARAQRSMDARRLGIPEDRLGFDIPERKPVMEDLRFVSDTVLLVQRTVVTGAAREADGFALRGSKFFSLTWPADTRLLEYDPNRRRGLGVRINADGEESVVVLQFSAP